MNEKTSKLTAKWWRKKLECNHHDNGDPSRQSDIAGIVADMLAIQNSPTILQLDKFEIELTKLIMETNSHVLTLYCDYAPCDILSKAAELSGIDSCCFPWKMGTQTTEEDVLVSDGYGKPYMKININDQGLK